MLRIPMIDSFIHKWVDNASSRTLLLLHGTGGDENDLLTLGERLDPSANYLSLRGNSRDEGTNRFFRRLSDGVFDEADLRFRTQELDEFLKSAEERKIISRSQTVAVGYSNGANIAASLLLLFPASVGGAVLMRAMSPYGKPVHVSAPNSPVLLLSGKRDPIVPESRKRNLIDQLNQANCEVTAVDLAAGHEIGSKDVELAVEWLRKLA